MWVKFERRVGRFRVTASTRLDKDSPPSLVAWTLLVRYGLLETPRGQSTRSAPHASSALTREILDVIYEAAQHKGLSRGLTTVKMLDCVTPGKGNPKSLHQFHRGAKTPTIARLGDWLAAAVRLGWVNRERYIYLHEPGLIAALAAAHYLPKPGSRIYKDAVIGKRGRKTKQERLAGQLDAQFHTFEARAALKYKIQTMLSWREMAHLPPPRATEILGDE